MTIITSSLSRKYIITISHRKEEIKMTRQDVINELNRLKTGRPSNDYDYRDKAIEIAKADVQKQIRKSVIRRNTLTNYLYTYDCPCCNNTIDYSGSLDFCRYCGQALDWSEYD